MIQEIQTNHGLVNDAGTHLHEEVGAGAHSVVCRATRGDDEYAVKFYNGSLPLEEALRLFRREAAIHAGSQNPAIPQVYEVGVHDGRPYIVSEFIRGQNLLDVLQSEPLNEIETVRVGMVLADALETIHGHGLVHRDVKPKNVLMSETGAVKLIDFGLATQGIEETQGAAVGTFRYSAPEQAGMLARPVDGRADLYSLGVMLFECLLGEPPFVAEDIGDLLHQHAAIKPPRVDSVRTTCDARLADIIAKLLNKDPDERYPTAASVYEALAVLDRPPVGRSVDRGVELTRRRAHREVRRIFVGRDEELSRLRQNLASLSDGTGRLVLVEGAPGHGKSLLMETFLEQHVSKEMLVVKAKCDATDPYPFAPFRDVLSELARRAQEAGSEASALTDDIRSAAGQAGGVLTQIAPELARVLGPAAESDTQWEARELFHNVMASFFGAMADARDGLVFWLDDVQWLDDASREVLQQLAACVAKHRLLLLLTARNDCDAEMALSVLTKALTPADLRSIRLSPLSGSEVETLIERELGHNLHSPFVEQLATRSGGNPLIIRQYLLAMKENGSLVPSWGRWVIDADALASVPLPTDIYGLMTSRLAMLSDSAQSILEAAAMMGNQIVIDQLVYVCDRFEFRDIQRALTEGLEAKLIERSPATQRYAFVHDRVREALVDNPSGPKTSIHRRATDYLESLAKRTDQQVFARAHHCRQGYGLDEPGRTFAACLDAGELAIAQHAYADAHELLFALETDTYLTAVDDRARRRFFESLGMASFQTDRVDEAAQFFKGALALVTIGVDRALLRAHIARAAVFSFDTRLATHQIEAAFEELGLTLPSVAHREPAALQAHLVGLLGESLALIKSGEGFGSATPDQRKTYKAIIDMCETGFLVGYYDRNPLFSMQCGVLPLKPACYLGETGESCQGLSTAAFLMGVMGKPDAVELLVTRAMEIAEKLGHPQTIANTQNKCGLGRHLGGDVDVGLELQLDVFTRYSDWLAPIAYQNCCVDLSWNYSARGYAAEELEVSQAAIRRLQGRETVFLCGYVCRATAAAMSAAATLGRMGEATRYFKDVERFEAIVPPDRTVPWVSVAGFRINYYLQQEDFGDGFERAVRDHDAWGIPPARSALHSKHFYLFHAYARLEILVRANPSQRELPLVSLKRAVDELDAAATVPTIRTHLLVLRAAQHMFEGALIEAWKQLDEARTLAIEHDNPWAQFEEARTRARLLEQRGKQKSARLEASRAHMIASRQGWRLRRLKVAREFSLETTTGSASAQRTASITVATALDSSSNRLHRQMDALLALSRASASVLDPHELARIALDESIRIFCAERAYLFIADETHGELIFTRGRSGTEGELGEPSEYSRTIIERVYESGRPMVMSTRADAHALGAESVVAYDIRSVLAGPLIAGDRVLGVIYLDNRLAHGVFNDEHIELLLALQSHIATAYQTARSAQLEVTLQKETALRCAAETLRELNVNLTSTLNLGESLERFADALDRSLEPVRTLVLIREQEQLEPIVTRGYDPATVTRLLCNPALCADVEQFGEAQILSQDPHGIAGAHEICLALPLRTRETLVGVAFLARPSNRPFDVEKIELGMTMAGQAGIAVENAMLFRRIRVLAEIDGLTGLYNRREFFRRAEERVQIAQAGDEALAALMFDVDHFKRFNDTYGHDTGDEVLKQVAALSGQAIRGEDILGRYGGEEFTVVLPGATQLIAAKVGERIRHSIASTGLATTDHGDLVVTVSVGVTSRNADDDLASMLSRADQALYVSKSKGRNAVTTV